MYQKILKTKTGILNARSLVSAATKEPFLTTQTILLDSLTLSTSTETINTCWFVLKETLSLQAYIWQDSIITCGQKSPI